MDGTNEIFSGRVFFQNSEMYGTHVCPWLQTGSIQRFHHKYLTPYQLSLELMELIIHTTSTLICIYTYLNMSMHIKDYIYTYYRRFSHSFIQSFNHSFIHSFILSFHFISFHVMSFHFIHSLIHKFIHSFMHSLIHSIPFNSIQFHSIHSFIHTYIRIHTFIRTDVHTYINKRLH